MKSGADSGQRGKQQLPSVRKKKTRTRIVIGGILLVLLIGGYYGYKALFHSDTAAAYSEVAVTKGDISVTISGTGAIEPVDQYEVISLVSGEILSAPFAEGDEISAGDTLYTIDSSGESTMVEKAALNLQQAQLSYNDSLTAADNLKIRAVAGGELASLNVEVGDNVSNGTVIAKIADDNTMSLTVPFNTQNAAKLSIGDSADVFLEDYLQTISGKVAYISSGTRVEGVAVIKDVEIEVENPGALTTANTAYATVNGVRSYASGNFEEGTVQDIQAQTSGKVVAVNYKEGDSVKAGSVIVELSSSTAGLNTESAALSLKSAQLSLEDAYSTLDNYTITSPISGTVISKTIKAGDTLDNSNNSTTMAVIADMSQLTFEMAVDELDISKLEVGQEVTITADALEDKTFSGYVDKISIIGTTSSGVTTYPVTVVINDSESSGLLPGMNVSAEIVVQSSSDVLTLPVAAIVRGNLVLVPDSGATATTENTTDVTTAGTTGSTAAAADGDSGKNNNNGGAGGSRPGMEAPDGYKYVSVTLGINDEDYVEIVSGLEEGDIVAVPVTSDATDSSSATATDNRNGGMMSFDEGGTPPDGGGAPPTGGGGF